MALYVSMLMFLEAPVSTSILVSVPLTLASATNRGSLNIDKL